MKKSARIISTLLTRKLVLTFDKVLRGMKRLLERRRQLRAATPVVNLRMLVTRGNEEQVPRMRRIARDAGADLFTVKTLCSFDNQAEGNTFLPCRLEYRRFEYDEKGLPEKISNPCKKLWNHPTVYCDGRLVPCDYHARDEFTLGNIFSGEAGAFTSAWFGRNFTRLRERFVSGDRSGLRCGTCSLNYADVDRCTSHALRFSHGEKM